MRLDAPEEKTDRHTTRQSVAAHFGMLMAVQVPKRPAPEAWRKPAKVLAIVAGLLLLAPATAQATNNGAFLQPQRSIQAPSGFNGLCARYDWVCASSRTAKIGTKDKIALAQQVNRMVNRQVRQIEDQKQYGKAEHWALPTRRGGDCEDLVLLKKKLLVERGVPSQALLISTVLDRRMTSHAVLVLRTDQGDLVLDNLTNRILPWTETGYTFLKLQNPDALSRWHAILARGDIRDQPTASR